MIQTGGNPVSGSFSVALWLQTTASGAGAPGDHWFAGTGILDTDVPGVSTDWGIAMTGNAVAFGIGGGSAGTNMTITSPSVNNGMWRHVVATWEQGTRQMNLFLDGAGASAALSNSSEARSGGAPLLLGKNTTAARYYKGLLDDVQIYGRALSSDEVAFLYNYPGQILH